jgi:molybdopterin synthase catalytic subunit
MSKVNVGIYTKPLCIEEARQFVSSPAHGANSMFLGTVRDHHYDRHVSAITFDSHPELASQTMQLICQEATGIWPHTTYYVRHRVGNLSVSTPCLLVAVGAPHRQPCLEACSYVIEEIKKRVTVWKQEHYQDGTDAWLPGAPLVAG